MRRIGTDFNVAQWVASTLAVMALLVAACAPAPPAAPAATAAPAQPTQPAAKPAAPAATTAAAPAAQPAAPTAAPAAKPTTPPPAAAAPKPTTAPQAAPADTKPPQRGGTLTYAATVDVENLDPAYTGGTGSHAVKSLFYNGLVEETPTLEIVPDLALTWAASGTAWTLTLRQGVKFHDGTPFNAQAVKAHYDRIIGPEKPLRAIDWVQYLDGVDVVDDNTVRFRVKFEDAFFLSRLADSSFIESPDAFQKFGKDLARNPVGTGPFKFKEWVPDVRVVAVRNDDYWGTKAYLDQVIIRPIPEAGARAIALESGDVQLATYILPEHMQRLNSNPNLQLLPKETSNRISVGMVVLKKPFDDLRVRQALNYAIDRETIAQVLYGGLATIVPGAITRLSPGSAEVTGFPYDPARARALLAEAGLPNGFTTTMTGARGRNYKDFEVMQAIQQQLKEIGVEVNLSIVEFARFLELVRMPPAQTPVEIWMSSYSGARATDLIAANYGCDSWRPAGLNVGGYCNKEVDRLVAQAQRTLDERQRDALLKQAQQLLATDAPNIWGFSIKTIAGSTKKLHGVLQYAGEVTTVDENTWMEP